MTRTTTPAAPQYLVSAMARMMLAFPDLTDLAEYRQLLKRAQAGQATTAEVVSSMEYLLAFFWKGHPTVRGFRAAIILAKG